MLVTLVYLVYCLVLVYFSFSAFFGDNNYLCIFLIKVGEQAWGFIIEILVHEELYKSALDITGGVVSGLCTMGANDLVDFIGGYFVELGIVIIERAYLGEVLNFVFDYMKENVPKWIKGI